MNARRWAAYPDDFGAGSGEQFAAAARQVPLCCTISAGGIFVLIRQCPFTRGPTHIVREEAERLRLSGAAARPRCRGLLFYFTQRSRAGPSATMVFSEMYWTAVRKSGRCGRKYQRWARLPKVARSRDIRVGTRGFKTGHIADLNEYSAGGKWYSREAPARADAALCKTFAAARAKYRGELAHLRALHLLIRVK